MRWKECTKSTVVTEKLGRVPKHWTAAALKRGLTSGNSGGGIIKSRMSPVPQDGLCPGFSASGQDVWAEEAHYHRPGIVLSAVGARCGKAFKADGSWTAIANTHVLFPRPGYDRDYLWYMVNDETFWERGGTAQPYVRLPETLQRIVAFPPPSEQRAIAAFLDRETGRIDALIEKKQRQIELLQEKLLALVSRAVTKGLDPDVKMKDSGIEWLDRIPFNWACQRIAALATKITNGYVGPTRDILGSQGVKYLQSLHIKNNVIRFVPEYFVTKEWSTAHSKSILREDDVLVVQTGDIGQAAVVPEDLAGANCHALIIISCRKDLALGSFLAWVLNSHYGYHSLKRIQTGALHPHLNCTFVREVRVPVPPVEEQQGIAEYLYAQVSVVKSVIAKIEQSIEALDEYRSALISAAVTGKIIVREEAA